MKNKKFVAAVSVAMLIGFCTFALQTSALASTRTDHTSVGQEANLPRGQEGGAGRYKGQHFSASAHGAFQILAIGEPGWSYQDFAAKVKDVEAIPVPGLCYMDLTTGIDYCQDAKFVGGNPQAGSSPMIFFDEPNYAGKDCSGRMAMALHEYLRATGVEGNDYTHSGRFLNGNWEMPITCERSRLNADTTPEKQKECGNLSVARTYKMWELCASLDRSWSQQQ
jgi:hypothetical protein